MTMPLGVGTRLAEKSVELTFASQAGALLGRPAFWFGLTQAQEAARGYDAAVSVGARLLYFQFKVSNWVLASGARQFRINHSQLVALQTLVPGPGTVFYVLPDVGTHGELAANSWDLLGTCWYVDVNDIPASLNTPTTASGSPRKSGDHYAALLARAIPPTLVLHSEPTPVPLSSFDHIMIAAAPRATARGRSLDELAAGRFWEIRHALGRHAVAVAVQT